MKFTQLSELVFVAMACLQLAGCKKESEELVRVEPPKELTDIDCEIHDEKLFKIETGFVIGCPTIEYGNWTRSEFVKVRFPHAILDVNTPDLTEEGSDTTRYYHLNCETCQAGFREAWDEYREVTLQLQAEKAASTAN